MKKICLIIPNVFPVPAVKGGACEQLVTDFINENEKYKKLDITVISPFDEEAEQRSKIYNYTKFKYIQVNEEENKVRDLFYSEQDKDFIFYKNEIKKSVDLQEFDYIIIEGGNAEGYRDLLQDCDKEKCILHIHGNLEGNKEIEEIYGYFITVSNFVAEELAQNGIISRDRIYTIYNGINIEKFEKKISKQEKEELREKYNIKNDDIVILFCGRTVKTKGVKELLLAVEQMKNLDKSKLLIVGNSNFAKEVKTEYDQELFDISKRIPNKVQFTGFINNDILYKIHNISDIAVVPTIGEEAFGLVVVEAMSSGLPLITTISGGIPEIVGTDDNGILLKKDEDFVSNLCKALDYLIDNKEVREKLSIEEKKRAKEFDLDHYYNRFIEFFTKLDRL